MPTSQHFFFAGALIDVIKKKKKKRELERDNKRRKSCTRSERRSERASKQNPIFIQFTMTYAIANGSLNWPTFRIDGIRSVNAWSPASNTAMARWLAVAAVTYNMHKMFAIMRWRYALRKLLILPSNLCTISYILCSHFSCILILFSSQACKRNFLFLRAFFLFFSISHTHNVWKNEAITMTYISFGFCA